MPEVRPPLLPCQEEEVRRLWFRSYYYASKIFLAEQEDQQNPHSLKTNARVVFPIQFSTSRLEKDGQDQVPPLRARNAMDFTIEDILLRQ